MTDEKNLPYPQTVGLVAAGIYYLATGKVEVPTPIRVYVWIWIAMGVAVTAYGGYAAWYGGCAWFMTAIMGILLASIIHELTWTLCDWVVWIENGQKDHWPSRRETRIAMWWPK